MQCKQIYLRAILCRNYSKSIKLAYDLFAYLQSVFFSPVGLLCVHSAVAGRPDSSRRGGGGRGREVELLLVVVLLRRR